ncbi:unnamed protein product [Caenorhabditis angaria]|uniref:26S proteasome non-ATPase regulatory subunit 8 n=1 Tax=Caenorhabditis angaria TaxID=860376 RepID=A0A9P1IF24_9PELO|nr:unnamed protein product [Caenorhabditis angaria]
MAAAAHKGLLALWAKEPKDIQAIQKAVNDLSAALATDGSLNEAQAAGASKDLYEITALLAILKNDLEEFDDAINQVHTFYTMIPELNSNQFLMTGLHLMFLLARNRLSDFHMLLEQVPQKDQTSNPYISTPVKIEQSLMEGAYNKVVLTEKNIPSPFYLVFVRIMLDTVRNEIASSIEKSFKVLSAKDAAVMLLFDNEQQLIAFTNARKWKLDGKSFLFESVEVAQDKPLILDTKRITNQTLFYAKQLEQIV